MRSCLILALLDFTKPFELQCDASGQGVGAVVMKDKHPIVFESRKLRGDKRLYSTYDKEMLAIMHALAKFRQYLMGSKFVVKTDPNNLKHFMHQRDLNERQQKWVSLKVEDGLEGALNFTSWKVCVLLALEELELLQFVEDKDLTEPSDPDELKQFKKNALKAKKFLIDSVKDHLVPVIAKLKIAREMFKHLEGMYEINNISQALTLRQQLLQVNMSKGDSIMSSS
ncbi:uncharacterized protein LOC131066833 [Cryptomeria japonica]|uniref:uncharacterized protein LOC131066833 n=1 Tax=Cryptomeria japonica TaxID=3369 RepID=UPI0027DA349A|nr:uncharacterized protein LOC131066833 [Cryptomeria japonica]